MKVYQLYVTESDNRHSVQATYTDWDQANQHFKLLADRMDRADDSNSITLETLEVSDECIIDHDYPTCGLYMCRVCEDEEHELREQRLAEMEGEL